MRYICFIYFDLKYSQKAYLYLIGKTRYQKWTDDPHCKYVSTPAVTGNYTFCTKFGWISHSAVISIRHYEGWITGKQIYLEHVHLNCQH